MKLSKFKIVEIHVVLMGDLLKEYQLKKDLEFKLDDIQIAFSSILNTEIQSNSMEHY